MAGGLQVQRAAADRVVPVALELGGKDPAYVRISGPKSLPSCSFSHYKSFLELLSQTNVLLLNVRHNKY